MKKAWQEWKKIVKKIISVEVTIVFALIYIIIIIPISLLFKIFYPKIFLGSKYQGRSNSYWNKIPKRTYNLSFARKQ